MNDDDDDDENKQKKTTTKKNKKTVQFKPTIRIKEVRHRNNMTRQMVKDKYLDEGDYASIRQEIRQTVLLLMDGHSSEFIEYDGKLCVRGLEKRTRHEQRRRMKQRTELRHAVMTEQKRRRQQQQQQHQKQQYKTEDGANHNDDDDECLSRISRVYSDQCVREARRTAIRDSHEARMYLMSSSNYC